MQIAVLYISTALVFFAIDAVMLKNVMRPLFERHLGDALADPLRLAPAGIFYALYIGGLLWFVAWPGLRDGQSLGQVLVGGMILGAMAYGTYEFTSYAVMRDWHWHMTVVDTVWGTVLTGGAAVAGVWITRALTSA